MRGSAEEQLEQCAKETRIFEDTYDCRFGGNCLSEILDELLEFSLMIRRSPEKC